MTDGVLAVSLAVGSVVQLVLQDGQIIPAVVEPAAGGGGAVQWGSDGTTVDHNLNIGIEPNFMTADGITPLEITFAEWADGDVLEALWSMTPTVIGEGGTTFLRAYVGVSTDDGATWKVINYSGDVWVYELEGGAPANFVFSLTGTGSVAISGASSVKVRLAFYYTDGLLFIKSTADSTNGNAALGATLSASRIPVANVVKAPTGQLQDF